MGSGGGRSSLWGKWPAWEKRPTESGRLWNLAHACYPQGGPPATKPLVTHRVSIGFSVFSLKYEQKNKGHLTFEQNPQHESYTRTNQQIERNLGEIRDNLGKGRKTEKETVTSWHRFFFFKWHLCNRTGCYKKNWANEKISYFYTKKTEIKIHNVGRYNWENLWESRMIKTKVIESCKKIRDLSRRPNIWIPRILQRQNTERTVKEIIKSVTQENSSKVKLLVACLKELPDIQIHMKMYHYEISDYWE